MASKQSQKEASASKSESKKGGGASVSSSYSEPDWFDTVTGTNDFERQSWRDNFNGGKAAGDWTGNVNASLQSERDQNYGATVSGSSTQYSAAEVQAMVAQLPERVQAEMRGAAQGLPQQAVTANSQSAPAGARPAGVATGVFQGAFGSSMAYKPMDLVYGGFPWLAKPNVSNAEDAETRYGDLVSAAAGVAILGQDLGHNAARMYFGENYSALTPSQRLNILGSDAQAAVKKGAESAGQTLLQSFFGGMQAIEDWGRRNAQIEQAAQQAAQESAAAWDLRVELMEAEEARRNEPKWSGNVVAAPVHW